ncbi:SDR family oxidoreductase [Alicyclobacillus sp.]|uniref:SDR family oxidoreductase n=1 Tax=Alicyclobacillus sp. TaxID=61169 RepID=UPI0025BF471D|nr:SDR family oxidoreductase [Alicyclobacillus sp.]MCL6516541.1 SDR family oxidoreductase [Alicyclobacillus sp.]
MDFGVQGKTVLVLASSKGLGFATAKAFAAEGANVMLTSRSEAALREAQARIQQETGNGSVRFCAADVSRAEDIERLFSETEAAFGGVDVLVNNAGGPPPGNFDTVTEEQWVAAHELTLLSVVRATRRALPHMRKNQWGRIVNFTSSSIRQPIDNLILSNTYRAGILGLSKSLAIELAPDNILVNVIGPGRIATDRVAQLDANRARQLGTSVEEVARQSMAQIPLGRYGTPEEFAALALFLGSAANGYITGQAILVDGGMVKSL